MQNIKAQKLLVIIMFVLSIIVTRLSNDATFLIMVVFLFCPILFVKENKR